MGPRTGRSISGAKLAVIVGICGAVFAAASAVAAIGYSESLWRVVVVGLVLPPAVVVTAVAVALADRLSRG